jgi:hypothetical protein
MPFMSQQDKITIHKLLKHGRPREKGNRPLGRGPPRLA